MDIKKLLSDLKGLVKSKKFWLFALSFVMVSAASVGITLAIKNGSDSSEVNPPQVDYANDGNYYLSAVDGDYTLSLSNGKFALTIADDTKIGAYSFSENDIQLFFEDNTVAMATYANGAITLNYNNATYKFVEKVEFTVSYDVDGETVNAVKVMNGKTVAKPATPSKEGFMFVGWYADKAFATPFAFDATPVTADTTVYARFVEKTVGQDEFTATFIVDGEVVSVEPTVNGVLHELPVPTKAAGSFAGWWMSDDQDARKLTAQYTGQTLKENVNLYAVWEGVAPLVSVTENSVKWNALGVGVNYTVSVYVNGSQVRTQKTTSTEYEYDFTARGAASYVVEVSANGQTAKAYYNYNELDRVSNFTVAEPSMLVFNGVENAEKYLITVECGNAAHDHKSFDNGTATYFNFANCAMKEGGITFTVTAVADGYTSSVSEVFKYERKLGAVTGLRYNVENGTLEWNTVEKATSYVVEVTQGEQTDTYTVNGKTFSMKNYSGEISVKVSAVAAGYTSTAATLTYTSAKLTAPTDITVAGNEIQWSAVEGAAKYNVMIDGVKIGETVELKMSVPANYQAVGLDFAVSVQAVSASEAENSYYSDLVKVKYGQLNNVAYANGMLTWAPVGGVSKYEYTVNNGAIQLVEAGATSAKVAFTKAGNNVIVLTAKDSYGNVLGQSQEVVVKTYELVLESRSENGFTTQYLAVGDTIDFSFPNEMVKTGYNFDAWYNVPGGADANGAVFESTTYELNTPYTLYAYWTPAEFEVTLMLGQDEYAKVAVYYNSYYQLPDPNRVITGKVFSGWNTQADGKGVTLTDEQGNSFAVWKDMENKTLYPTWTTALRAEKVATGDGFAISMAAGLKEKALREITVPETWTEGEETLPVVAIASEAFYNCQSLEVINIPDTIRTIYIGEGGYNSAGSAFFGCENLKAINVYATEGTHETYFSSVDGVLLRHAQPNVSMENGTELYYFPVAKTGVYEVPNVVEYIPQKTFQRTNITDIIIPSSVSLIGRQAFERSQIRTAVFADVVDENEEVKDLVLSASAFAYCYSLTAVDLPARLTETDFSELKIFDNCTILREVNVIGKNGTYTSKDGMLCDASGRQIIYCPVGKVGEVVIPVSVQGIAEGAFKNCTKITNLVVGANVVEIGKEAFLGCRGITTVEFRGQAGNLAIGEKAFYGCTALRELELSENVTKLAEKAFGNTPLNTRVYLKAGANIEYANGAFMDDDGKGYVTNVVIGENMGAFEIKGVFAGCQIKGVTVEGNNANYSADDNGVLYNGDQTQLLFYPQKLIENYQLPETVTTIAAGVFEGNNDFTSFTIGANVTTISAGAFKNMARLQSVVFEEGRTAPLTIGDSAFEGCSALNISLPETLVSIGAYAFKDCASITSLTLPSTLTTLGNETESGVFDGCSSLGEIQVAEGNQAFESRGGILYGKTEGVATTLFFVPASYQGEVVIPKTVHTVPEMAFYGHAGITSVSFEDNEAPLNIRIGASAFAEMKAVQKVVLPTNLTIISTGMFENSSVTEVFVPNTVNTIQLKAFYKASKLATLTFEEGNEDNILVLEDGEFRTTNAASIDGILYGAPLTTSGLVFPERVKRIPDYYFGGSTFTSVTIPASIEYIGVGAFLSSKSIKTLTFAGDATTRAGFVLGFNAFSGCSGVTSLVVPASITKFEGEHHVATNTASSSATGSYHLHGAFRGMSGLTSLTFEEGVTSLSVGMFYGSGTSTAVVTLPDSLVTIADAAFNTAKFKSVTFGKNLTTIGKHAFSNATNLATVDFSKNEQLTTIGDYAFEKCTKLTTVVLPDNSAHGVEELTFGKTIFSGCTALTAATIPATVKNLNSAFAGCTKVVVTHVGNEASADANGFMLTADGKRLVKYSGTATDVTVPDGVEIIGDNAFSGNKKITKVTLPTSVKVLEGYAFNGCTKLATVEGGDGLMSIGAYAFSGTVITSVDLTGILTVGEYAFYNCKKLSEVVLDDNMTTIANGTFKSCSALAQIDLPVNLTTLGYEAFYSAGLTSIVLPSKLKNTEMSTASGYWFGMCTKLTSVTIESTDLGVLPYYAFYYCSALTSIEIPEGVTAIIASFAYSGIKDITFPSSLQALYGADILGGVFSNTKIETLDFSHTKLDTFDTIYDNGEKSVFAYMSSLKTVIFPEMITTLPTQLFESSNALVTVVAPGLTTVQSVSSGGTYFSAFKNKSKLTTVQLSPELVSIGNYAFYGCTSLAEFNFTDSLTTIGDYAFYNTKLSNLAFGDKLETIGEGAFYNTLVETVTLPASVTEIGLEAFGSCDNLARFEVSTSNPRYYSGNYGELYDNTKTLICFPVNATGIEGVVDLSAEMGITLSAYAFSGCKNIQKVVLPADMYEIPEGLFAESAITEITLPEGVTKIGAYAFYRCTGLTEIKIPENVNVIGTDAFFGCSNVAKFVVDPDNANYHTGSYGELYDSANNLLYFPAKATVEGGVVTLATGAKLGTYAFSGLSGVTEVVLPSDLKAIPEGAFENSSITTITIPASVTSISEGAFSGSALETLIFADRTDNWTIPAYLFQGVTTLKTVTMGSGIASIGNYAFDACSSLANLTLSSSLTSIGTYAFRGCASLTSLTVPNGVTSIGKYAFANCTALTSITLPNTLKSIGDYAFQKCTLVKQIVIPQSVTTIGTKAFNNWTSSQTIYAPGRSRKPSGWKSGFNASAKVQYNKMPA